MTEIALQDRGKEGPLKGLKDFSCSRIAYRIQASLGYHNGCGVINLQMTRRKVNKVYSAPFPLLCLILRGTSASDANPEIAQSSRPQWVLAGAPNTPWGQSSLAPRRLEPRPPYAKLSASSGSHS
jgi:hypothetical protein